MGMLNTAGDIFSGIGKISAIFTLIMGIFFAILFFVIGIMVMVKQKSLAGGFILIFISIICIAFSFGYYYIVMNSKTISTIAGVGTVASLVLDGGKKSDF